MTPKPSKSTVAIQAVSELSDSPEDPTSPFPPKVFLPISAFFSMVALLLGGLLSFPPFLSFSLTGSARACAKCSEVEFYIQWWQKQQVCETVYSCIITYELLHYLYYNCKPALPTHTKMFCVWVLPYYYFLKKNIMNPLKLGFSFL